MAKETYFFSHDYNARTDPKIKKLLVAHGFTGYGVYWAIVEDLYNNANALPLDYDSIAYDLRIEKNALHSILNDYGLFVIKGDVFGSASVERRLASRMDKSEKARNSASKRWERNANASANAMRTQSEGNALKDSIVKDKIEKEINISFDVFWGMYGKKVGDKEKVKAKWHRLSNPERERIIEHLPKYVASKPEIQFRKDPATYLNNKTWEDEIIPSTPPKNIVYKSVQQRVLDGEDVPKSEYM